MGSSVDGLGDVDVDVTYVLEGPNSVERERTIPLLKVIEFCFDKGGCVCVGIAGMLELCFRAEEGIGSLFVCVLLASSKVEVSRDMGSAGILLMVPFMGLDVGELL